jgi:ferredoxin
MEMTRFSFFDRIRIPDYDTLKNSQSGDLIFNPELCRQCGICVQLCPGGCLLTETTKKMDIIEGRAKGGKYGVPHVTTTRMGATLCIACFDCGAACPHGAISIRTNFNPGLHFKRLTQTNDMRYPKRY